MRAKQPGSQQLEAQFCEKLREAKSNLREYGNGEEIYKKWVAPAIVTADKVMGHYAVSSLFESYGDKTKILLLHGRTRAVQR